MIVTISVLTLACLSFMLAAYSRAAPELRRQDSDIADYPPVLPGASAAQLDQLAERDRRGTLRREFGPLADAQKG